MGLFGFSKKKEAMPPAPFDIGDLKTDLPSIEGLKLPEGSELPSLELPPIEGQEPTQSDEQILNNRLPGIRRPIEEQDTAPEQQNPLLEQDTSTNTFFDAQNITPSPNAQFADLSTEINQLFLSDPNWKEPDWDDFVPYTEPVIEPPAPQDFPAEEIIEQKPAEQKEYDLPVFEVLDQTHKPLPSGDLPYDVFVKGQDFKKIIDDVNLIKSTLTYQDNQMSDVMEKFKNEAEMISYNKELMEFLYKKMIYVEKKVFA